MPHYNYIILGAGASGLFLADALGKDPYFAPQSILLIDKAPKNQNDRTWCFWEKGNSPLDFLVHKSWPRMYVAGKTLKCSTTLAPYTYKMIRGIDFYEHYSERFKKYPNLTRVQETVKHIEETPNGVRVETNKNRYFGNKVFNSLFEFPMLTEQDSYPVLQQHFLGWWIKMEKAVFNPEEVTFMDFSIPQKGNTRFIYLLPFSPQEALVEYTLFSKNVLAKRAYEAGLSAYLNEKYKDTAYSIEATEQGNIPMTCYPFAERNTARIFHIGIAGGWAKPSSGFTFYNTHKQVEALAGALKEGKPLSQLYRKDKFWWYDLVLLDVLYKKNAVGSTLFERLFTKRKATLILKFLSQQTSLWEDFKICTALPPLPFVRALLKRVFKRFWP